MKLREELELAHAEHLNELSLGFITNAFQAMKDKTTEYVRNKVLSGWKKIKVVLAQSEEDEKRFLDYLGYIFDREFTIEDIDNLLLQTNEAVTWQGIKTFIKENYKTIFAILAVVAQVALQILRHADLGLAMVSLVVTIAMMLKEGEELSAIKDIKKRTDEYQAKTNKLLKVVNKLDKTNKALAK